MIMNTAIPLSYALKSPQVLPFETPESPRHRPEWSLGLDRIWFRPHRATDRAISRRPRR